MLSYIVTVFALNSQKSFKLSQIVKNLPAMQETGVQPLGQQEVLEKEMTTHSSILAWKVPWWIGGARQATVHGIAKSWT